MIVVGVSIAVALTYVAWHAPVLNWSGRVDQWFYLGFFTNFHFLFVHYGFTYYAGRLPWIIVGRFLYTVFPPLAAFFVMHVAFFIGGAVAVYVLCRRYYDRTVALVAYTALIANSVYFVSHANDYVDGPVITLLLVTLVLVLPRGDGTRALISTAFAGFCFAAAFGTNLAAGPFGSGLVFVWACVRLDSHNWRTRALRDALAFIGGAVALFVAVGAYSKIEGGHAFFIQPQLNALGQLHSPAYRAPGWYWLVRTPKVFVVPALLVLLGLVRPRRPFSDSDRLVLGSAAYGLYLVGLAVIWEHWGGALLETPFYFSLFTPGTVLLLAAVLRCLRVDGTNRRSLIWIAAAAVTVAALPNVIVYAGRPSAMLLSGKGALFALGLGVVAAIGVVATRWRAVSVPAVALAAVAIVGGTNLAAAASRTTAQDLTRTARGSFTDRRHDMDTALALSRYLQRTRTQDAPMAFWAADSDTGPIRAMLSTYLYMWPTAGRHLPEVDSELRQRLVYLHPYHLVLLCPHSCARARNALSRAGYTERTTPISTTLGSGSNAVHVQVVNLPANRVRGPYDKYARFYAVGQTALTSRHQKGKVISAWNLRRGTPQGWTGASVDATNAAHGATFDTGNQPWEYELASTSVGLAPGTYAAYLSGSIVFGGLDLGALDSTNSKWLGQSLYWFRQVGFASRLMAVRFRLRAPTHVQLILSNWIPSKQSSRWSLRDLRLVRLGP